MGDMAAVAERLRMVRAARRRFLRMWAIDQELVTPLLDRLAADLAPVDPADDPAATPGPAAGPVHDDPAGADKG